MGGGSMVAVLEQAWCVLCLSRQGERCACCRATSAAPPRCIKTLTSQRACKLLSPQRLASLQSHEAGSVP